MHIYVMRPAVIRALCRPPPPPPLDAYQTNLAEAPANIITECGVVHTQDPSYSAQSNAQRFRSVDVFAHIVRNSRFGGLHFPSFIYRLPSLNMRCIAFYIRFDILSLHIAIISVQTKRIIAPKAWK